MIARCASAAAVAALLVPASAGAAARLKGADVRVTFESATACAAVIAFQVEDAADITQRIEVMDGAVVDHLEVSGATVAGPASDSGRTRLLVTHTDTGAYTLRYSASLPAGHPGRCPLWVPTIPADGRSAAIRITVRIPDGSQVAGTMPTFTWAGTEGTAAIGHVPAFVRVPFARPGEPAPWNIARVMDIFSIATLVIATLAWARRQRMSQDLKTPGPQDPKTGGRSA